MSSFLVLLSWTLVFACVAAESAVAGENGQCLACHGQPEIRSDTGHRVTIDGAKHGASVHGALGCTTCHSDIKDYPHPKKRTKVECATCHSDPASDVPKSAHAVLGAQACVSCHGDVHETQPSSTISPKQCSSCHAQPVHDYQLGIHAAAWQKGDRGAATCQSCHGPAHKLLAASNPASTTAKRNLPETCGACHANPEFLARHNIPFAHPVEAYRLSVHGRAVAAGVSAAASCSDCHSNHAIFPARDPRSKVNHWNVPQTCGSCHGEIEGAYAASIHGQAVARGARDAAVCTDCHGEHTILAPSEPRSLVNPARVSSATCGRCHGDERLAQRYNLPLDKVPAFQDSYHGLALRAGSQMVANCASCHGVHNILPSSDPRSTVHSANLAHTCGQCHSGAGQSFAIGPVHVRPGTTSEHAVVKWIRVAYWVLIPLALGFMVLHNALDFLAKLVRGVHRSPSGEQATRMNLHFRLAHWLVMLSFPILIVTGFALKFPEAWWAQPLLRWEGRFAFRGILHRTAAVVLIASVVYHVVHLAASRKDRVVLRFLRPVIKDWSDLLGLVRYNLGVSSERPHFGKFSYAEKIEYWAFIWGFAVMGVSGFLLWFNNFTLRYFPKWVADAATAVHYYEAILATFSILIWHFYLTLFDPEVYPMDRAWLTGKVSEDHLRETRPGYYLELLLEQLSKIHAAGQSAPARPKSAADDAGPKSGREGPE